MPQHIVHETYNQYERRNRGPTGVYVGVFITIVGLIFFGYSVGILDRVLFGGVIVLGLWLIWRGMGNTFDFWR